MQLICWRCKGKIAIGKELASIFQCHVTCEKRQKEMREKVECAARGVNEDVKSALESYWSFVTRVRYAETSGDGVPVRVV